jgi:CRP-like cAMP-binding protein
MAQLNRALIGGLPVFQELAPEELDEIVGLARSARYKQDANVFEQDGEAHSFFVLLDGYIRVVRTTPQGEKIIVRYIGDGEPFGIAAALGRTTYPATAEAAVDCVALVWPSSLWAPLSSKFPSFRTGTYKTVGARLEETQSRIIELTTERVEQRVASALTRLADQSGRTVPDGVEIDFPLTRADIAEMTGTTLHTVSRLLSRWEDQGWVSGRRQRIVVRNQPALSGIARRPVES